MSETSKAVSSSVLLCKTPESSAGSVTAVEASNNGQQYSDDGLVFVFREEQRAVSMSPSVGPAGGGTVVTVALVGMHEASAVWGRFGKQRVAGTRLSGSSVAFVSPPSGEGIVQVEMVGAADGGGALEFEYAAMPQVVELVPSMGPVDGGVSVTLLGTGFREGAMHCRFGGAPRAVHAVVASSTAMQCGKRTERLTRREALRKPWAGLQTAPSTP